MLIKNRGIKKFYNIGRVKLVYQNLYNYNKVNTAKDKFWQIFRVSEGLHKIKSV